MSNKNVVFMPYINLGDNRNESYDLSVKSWKKWCDKNDVDLFVWDELVFPIERMWGLGTPEDLDTYLKR